MGFLGVYGHVNVDYLLHVSALPAQEVTVPVQRSSVRLGGTAGNIARAAAAMGVPTSLAGFVGDDFPAAYRRQLDASGIDLTDLRQIPGPTPKVWVLNAPDGSQGAIIDQGVMGDGYERPLLDYAWLSSEWVHLTTGDPEGWSQVAAQAARARKSIALDPGQELRYRYPSRLFEEFLNRSDIFFCNQVELQQALDLLGYGDVVQMFDHTRRIIVTEGAQGARILTESGEESVPACPLQGDRPLDPTGAGDVFRGGVYAGLHRDLDWFECARAGAVATTLFLESGSHRFPAWDEVVARREAWTG